MIPLVEPLGVGDLKVTKQALVRYEPGEVAHIENVLRGESRSRRHRRLTQIEETTALDTQREEETTRDLQSTERFEIETESQRTLMAETSFEAGIELSGGFGPVNVSAYARFASNESTEESDTSATKYAKEVVDKTLSRLVEQVRQERRRRTLDEVEETNKHGFENQTGNNIAGIYRWVDKIYRQKVVNYGRRLMYRFVVPEPAVFFVFAERASYEKHVLPTKPAPPVDPVSGDPLTPTLVNRYNWSTLVAAHGAEGVEPPPPETINVGKPLSRSFPDEDHWAFANEDLAVPKGYEATLCRHRIWYSWDSGGDKSGRIMVGRGAIDFDLHPIINFPAGTVGKVPISGVGVGIRGFGTNIIIECKLTKAAWQSWQVATYEAIMGAYSQQLMDYEERIASVQIQQGMQLGSNPLVNREIERTELKRACLSIWAGAEIDLPAGVSTDPDAPVPVNYPTIIRATAAGNARAIDFFETAFDWQNMAYELHPYFWGRQATWIEAPGLESSDPLHEKFLKAGAATVTVPVQPSHTEAVLWYQLTGDIWPGGPIPELTPSEDPRATAYSGYLVELGDLTDLVDVDTELDIDKDDPDAWIVRVPTTLVWLQDNSQLPDLEPPE